MWPLSRITISSGRGLDGDTFDLLSKLFQIGYKSICLFSHKLPDPLRIVVDRGGGVTSKDTRYGLS